MAVSLWLNSGVPATEVPRRLGHDVAVLLKIYASCIDGQENAVNGRIAAALGGEPAHGTLDKAADPSDGPVPPVRTRCGPGDDA